MQEQNGTHQDHSLMSPASRKDELSLDWSREGSTRSNREEEASHARESWRKLALAGKAEAGDGSDSYP